MSLTGYFTDLIGQQPLGSTDSIAALNAKIDATNALINADQSNIIYARNGAAASDAFTSQVNEHYGQSTDLSVTGQASQVDGAFVDGASDGLHNEVALAKDAVKNPLGLSFRLIPLQWWIIAGAVLFVWLGGIDLVRGAIRRKANS